MKFGKRGVDLPLSPRVLLRLGLVGCGLLLGCRSDGAKECRELLAAEEHAAAARSCEELFATSGSPEAGLAAARAHSALGHGDQVLLWLDRLRGTPQEGASLRLAARVHHQRQELDKALAAFERAADLLRAAGDSAEAAKSLYGLFYIHWDAGRFRPALTYAHAAAAEAEAAGDAALRSTALSGVFTIHYELGDLDGARLAAEAAKQLGLAEDRSYLASFLGTLYLDQNRPALARLALEEALLDPATDRRFSRSVHLNLVRANLELGELDRAERHLESAWTFAEPEGREQSALLSFQARLERRRGRLDEAAETLDRALAQNPHTDWRGKLLSQKGRVEEERGHPGAARDAYLEAMEIVEGQRAELGFDDLKPWLLEARRQPFEGYFLLAARSGDLTEAVDAVERAKARTFLDAHIAAVAPASVLAEPTSGSELGAERLSGRIESLQSLLPRLRASQVASPRPLEEIGSSLRGRHVVLYFRAREDLWQIVVRSGAPEIRRLEIEVAEAGRWAGRLAADPGDPVALGVLSRALLPPSSLPAPGAELLVAADPTLDGIPFALLEVRGQPLVTRNPVLHVPSLNALVVLSERARDSTAAPVVLGDPRGDLPAARREVLEVAAHLGSEPQVGSAADRTALDGARRARVLHLATHAGSGAGGPWLALADGELEAAEVLERQLAPELVVLASCSAASRRGLGTWGSLGATFLAAGSRHVLAALGPIEDEAARRFVLRFYAHGGAADPARGLARAQREALAEGIPAAEWAPFVILGAGIGSPVS